MKKIWIIKAITFLSAFLLFQVELIVGKIFLPNFGGSYMVWGACLVFFQAALLLGYMYAHYIVQWLGMKRYRVMHLVFILLPFLFFPGRPMPLQFTPGNWLMVMEVFLRLTIFIGPVFFVLSTISIIWQAWLSDSNLSEHENPYVLFSVSNLGSFIALLSYPFFFEMQFDLNLQQTIWRIGYVFLIILQYLAFGLIKLRPVEKSAAQPNGKVTLRTTGQWLLYAAGGVAMFISATNILTAEIAPVPLLWVLPLAIYLLSFVLNFKQRPWGMGWMERSTPLLLALGIVVYFSSQQQTWFILFKLLGILVYTFLICMLAQRQLYVTKPKDPQQLTFYYFMMALGSFLGGIVSTWIVPLLSSTHMEFFSALLCICLGWNLSQQKRSFSRRVFIGLILLAAILAFGPVVYEKFSLIGFWACALALVLVFAYIGRYRYGVFSGLLLCILSMPYVEPRWAKTEYSFSKRNYYGINRIVDKPGVRLLLHGTTIHGGQFKDPKKSYIPLTYYTPDSPSAQLLIRKDNLDRVAFIGLGTGALTIYLKPQQEADIYELDPDIVKIAQEYFSFLERSVGRKNFILGDARISLEKQQKRDYKLLIVDAFSGDSVPVHLLTQEALSLYRQHMSPDGIVVFHVSNRFVGLTNPLAKVALHENAYVLRQHHLDKISKVFRSDWVAVTWDQNQYNLLKDQFGWKDVPRDPLEPLRLWSDAYSNIIPFLDWNQILQSMKNFKKS